MKYTEKEIKALLEALEALKQAEQTFRNVANGCLLGADTVTIFCNEIANIQAAIARAKGDT